MADWEKKKQALLDEIDDLKDEVNYQKSLKEKFEKEKDRIEKELDEIREEHEDDLHELQLLSAKKIQDLEIVHKAALQKEIDFKNQTIQERDLLKTQLQTTEQNLSLNISVLTTENTQLKKRLEQEVGQLTQKLEEEQKERSELDKIKKRLEKQLESSNKIVEDVEKEKSQNNQTILSFKEQVISLKEKLEESQNLNTELSTKIKVLNEELHEVRGHLESFEGEKMKLEKEKKKITEELEQLREEHEEDSQTSLIEARKKFEEIDLVTKHKIEQLTETLKKAETEKSDLLLQLEDLKSKFNTEKKNLEAQLVTVTTQLSETLAVKTENADLKTKLEAQKAATLRSDKAKKGLEKLLEETQVGRLVGDQAFRLQDNSTKDQEFELLGQKLIKLQTERRLMTEELEDLRNELEEALSAKSKMEADKKKLEDDLEEQREEHEEEMEEHTAEAARKIHELELLMSTNVATANAAREREEQERRDLQAKFDEFKRVTEEEHEELRSELERTKRRYEGQLDLSLIHISEPTRPY
eukprot:TRINITY_DN7158_c0_g1_i1.p1 TRINITY_DN7158_c0_g1~~TRINITY_DN7158_c0_g1_i1.p1  ORF type:complete len:548 (+),score=165.24 TRINITY_DN7158_c0_g1_i1:62-1645(+)